jgi:hypothetical protein
MTLPHSKKPTLVSLWAVARTLQNTPRIWFSQTLTLPRSKSQWRRDGLSMRILSNLFVISVSHDPAWSVIGSRHRLTLFAYPQYLPILAKSSASSLQFSWECPRLSFLCNSSGSISSPILFLQLRLGLILRTARSCTNPLETAPNPLLASGCSSDTWSLERMWELRQLLDMHGGSLGIVGAHRSRSMSWSVSSSSSYCPMRVFTCSP